MCASDKAGGGEVGYSYTGSISFMCASDKAGGGEIGQMVSRLTSPRSFACQPSVYKLNILKVFCVLNKLFDKN